MSGKVQLNGDLKACTFLELAIDLDTPTANGTGVEDTPCDILEFGQTARFGQYTTAFPSSSVSGSYSRKSAEADVDITWVGGAQTTNEAAHVGMQAVGFMEATADLRKLDGCCDSDGVNFACFAESHASFEQSDLTFQAELEVTQGGTAVFEPYVVESSNLDACEESVNVRYEVLGTSISGVLTESNTTNPTTVFLTAGTYDVRLTIDHGYTLDVAATQGEETCLAEEQCVINVAIGANLTFVP